MRNSTSMIKKVHCPRCKSEDIIEYDEFIHCIKCKLDFDKKFLNKIDDDDILARQEVGGFYGTFNKAKNQKKG